MKNQIPLSEAIAGYELAAQARRLSEKTIADYQNTFNKFTLFLDNDPPLDEITPDDVRRFLAGQAVSKKTLLNYHTGLSALWTWAVEEELTGRHLLRRVERPQPEKRAIVPYTEDDVKKMLAALGKSRPYWRAGQALTVHSLPNPARNRAIILALIDTGLRASELCELRIHHLDLRNRRVRVFGKGAKERVVPFSPRTGQVLWRYLKNERHDALASEPLFITTELKALDRHVLRQTLERIGRRAEVPDVNVHRFRHTFAINYLRNGGDPWSLQLMLGHSTLDMVRSYLAIAQADLDANHRLASPVANWNI